MSLKKISSGTIAILVGALFVFATGTYTENSGFQLAGSLVLIVGCILAFNQLRDRDD